MIEAYIGKGRAELAMCRCDACEHEISLRAAHGNVAGGKSVRLLKADVRNIGQVTLKLSHLGWSLVKGRLYCPTCSVARKKSKVWINEAKEELEMTEDKTVTELRSPTREQRRDIRAALDLVYDLKAEKYIGAETDLTIAVDIGGGCMPGWVSEIRESDYGPDGGNQEMETAMAAIDDLMKQANDAAAIASALQRDVTKLCQDAAAMRKTLSAIKAAVGPKAARA